MSTKLEAADGRKRQSRRDEQIRRILEEKISKRQHRTAVLQPALSLSDLPKGSSAKSQGSVMALKPMASLTMPHSTTVLDAAQYMTAYRAGCVLVLDDDSAVCGIFTAKDLAFKIISQHSPASQSGVKRDLRRVLTVADIMTAEPVCTHINSSATEALSTMVSRGFRHLPIMDDKGEIAGVLDITQCFFEAMTKLERACASSQKLREALQSVDTEMGSMHPQQIMNYVQALKEHTSGPELRTLVDCDFPPISIDVRSTVVEAATRMREHGTTAILVMDRKNVAGIFTTKDIVLRVLAADIDPSKCSVMRVMTPNPDCATLSMNIQEALRKMHTGKYLNLPIKNDDNEIVDVVDVLRLTYATLEHLSAMTNVEKSQEIQEGPAWDKFWMSLDQEADNESASNVYPHGFEDLDGSSQVNVSDSELAEFSLPVNFDGDSTVSESFDNNMCSDLTSRLMESHFDDKLANGLITDDELRPEDSMSRLGISSSVNVTSLHDDMAFSIKFKAPSGRAHRITVKPSTTITELRSSIISKLSENDLITLGGEENFAISYIDDDKDAISMTAESDIYDAIQLARKAGIKRVEIFLHHVDKTPIVKQAVSNQPNEGGIMPMLVGSAAAMMFGMLAWGRK